MLSLSIAFWCYNSFVIGDVCAPWQSPLALLYYLIP